MEIKDRRWMPLGPPMVEVEQGAKWLPEDAHVPFLMSRVPGKPKLAEHVPDPKTNTVFPKNEKVVKDVTKWVEQQLHHKKLSQEHASEWQWLFRCGIAMHAASPTVMCHVLAASSHGRRRWPTCQVNTSQYGMTYPLPSRTL